MKNGKIELEVADGIATMTLADPQVLNAFGAKLRADMSEALDQVEAGDARCLLITGAGRGFCSGANLADPDGKPRDRAAEARGEMQSDLVAWYNPTFIRLRALRMPIVAAINGVAAGAGMSLALSADIKLARALGVFPAGVRPHRPGAGLRLILRVAAHDRHDARDGAGAARRAAAGGDRARVGTDQPRGR